MPRKSKPTATPPENPQNPAPDNNSIISTQERASGTRLQWWEPFEAQIIEWCLRPVLIDILQRGVNSKADLLRRWEEATGVRVSPRQMDRWLEATQLDSVFSETRRFRLELPTQIPNLPPPQQPTPPPYIPYAPQGAQQAGGRYQLPHRNPQYSQPPQDDEPLPPNIRPVIPSLSRMPGGPPPRTMITDQGPVQVPADTFM